MQSNLKRLEALKPRINERYDFYLKRAQEQEARRKSQQHRTSTDSEHAFHSRTQLQAHENTDLAARMAQKEFSRRVGSRQASSRPSAANRVDLSDRLRAIGSQVEPENRQIQYRDERRPVPEGRTSSEYRYPSVPLKHEIATHISSPPARQSYEPLSPPALPPKPDEATMRPPARPEKIGDIPPRSITPQNDHMFAPSATLESGSPLRPLFLPPTLRTTFLRIAHKNTTANLETCAFLAGTLMKNAFFVSKLIVPAQTSTSDTCEMTNESQLFDYVDAQDLMVLGWIHTHPTQTCFMSSRDLHTHSGYQMMLAESIAIVCAPSKGDTTYGGDWGAYRLTDPPGKKAVLNCEKPGIFHPHEVDNIYTNAMKPGHVVELKGMEFEVVDLR